MNMQVKFHLHKILIHILVIAPPYMECKFISNSRMGSLLLTQCTMSFLQLSQAPVDNRPSYDAIQGANTTPTAFYNIGDLEIQDNLARIWWGPF